MIPIPNDRNDQRGDPWLTLPKLGTDQTSGNLEAIRTGGDPSRFYATGRGGQDDAVSARILDQPRAKAYCAASAPTLGAGVATAVIFDSTEFDRDGMWRAASPTRLTCVTPGLYNAWAGVAYNAATGDNNWTRIVANGVTVIAQITDTGALAGFSMEQPLSGPWLAKTGDYIEFWLVSTIGCGVYNGAVNCFLAACRMSTIGSDNQ